MEEVWKKVENYPNYYVSNYWRYLEPSHRK